MSVLIHPSYFPNIATCVGMADAKTVILEAHDNYQKQTYRNRSTIYGANGKLTLTVPVIFTQIHRQLYKDIKIANDENWQSLHWKSLQSAYRTSPFFEHYEEDLIPLFQKNYQYLFDLNLKCLSLISDWLQWELIFEESTHFEKDAISGDLRSLIEARKTIDHNFKPYTQVFSYKHGFIQNLSVLDLIFNEGPNALNYLEGQTLKSI